jgi:Zn-dependent protease
VFGSIPVGRLFGITVRVHWMWLGMLLFLPLMVEGQPMASLVGFLVLFGIVLLHELGHSLMARQFHIRTLDITLWPLGGMARMDNIPEKPKVEFWVAIAGPLVNFALAFVGGAAVLALTFVEVLQPLAEGRWSALEIAWGFLLANLAMGVFNLVPAFPMDGGRVLRAFLANFVDWVRATTIAVYVGRMFAFAMIGVGVLGWIMEWPPTYWLPLLGVFLWLAGARELLGVRLRRAQSDPRFAAFGFRPPDAASTRAADVVEPPAPAPPSTPDDPSGARRPQSASLERPPRGPLSAEDIARLERFPGRLRPPRTDANDE